MPKILRAFNTQCIRVKTPLKEQALTSRGETGIVHYKKLPNFSRIFIRLEIQTN